MPPLAWRHALVLGGIRSGKSEFAEELAGSGPVRYVTTARDAPADPEWSARIAAHRARRPARWGTSEVGEDPRSLADLVAKADTRETLLIEDLGTWAAGLIEDTGAPEADALVARLVDAVRACPAKVVLVSPEVGLSVVPPTAAGRAFADTLGRVNRAIADACDVVTLVVAGQVVWLKGGP
jgi:adenosyl cobinamide kinase/adenosyl cobinamide phosphate guanylyltransferase